MSTTTKQQFSTGGGTVRLLTTLALLSGCCGLAYEVLYVRSLTVILGDMFYVHAALLSTFLVGIGLGAKIAHRWLRWLWVFEMLTGLCALGLPIASRWLSQQAVMRLITSSPALTIFATMALISVPSLLLGFSIPLFSAYIKAYQRERLAFQGIYKVYNLGAFLSVLGVELVLIRYFGIRLSLAVIGAINLFNGVALLVMRLAPARQLAKIPRSFPKRSIAALAMASLGSAVFQMFFFKLSYVVFYPHRENFAIAVSVTLLGLFLGTWLVSKVRIRFETILVLVAFLIGLIYVNYLSILRFYEATLPWMQIFGPLILAHKFFFGCLFALGPLILFGATIPALMRSESEVAEESGHLLWVSSLANATGYLVYVLLGHPLLTNGVLLALIAGLLLLASLLSAGFRWSKVQGAFAVVGIVLMVFLVFRWEERYFYLAHWVNELKAEDEVKVFKSGAESATLVRADRVFKSEAERGRLIREQEDKNIWEDVWISYNGHPSITIQRNGVANFAEVVVGVTPALSAPRLDRALVIGFGTGITAGATSLIFNTTDVVEINEAFYKMMPHLSHVNFDIERNPSALLHVSDGRAFLVGKDRTYDVIISTVSAPTYFSASKIYTVDFYDQVRKSLKVDGLFCTWIAAAEMSGEGMLTILSAIRHSFRYCELRLLRANYYLLTCSNQPIHAKRHFSELSPTDQRLTRQLQRGLHGFDLDEFFEDILLSENIFDHFAPEVSRENTDDHPVLEFMAVRGWQLRKMGKDPLAEKQASLSIDPIRRDELADPARFARRVAVFWRLGPDYFENFGPILMKDPNVASEFFFQAAKHVVSEGKPDEAIKFLTTVVRIRPDYAQAHDNLGTVLKSQGQLNKAISHFRQALQAEPNFAEAHNNLGNALASQGKLDEAISHFRQALQAEPNFAEAHNNLGNALASQGKLDEAVQIFQEALAYNEQADLETDMADIHVSLGRVLKQLNRTEQAAEHFNEGIEKYRDELRKNPAAFEVWVRLGDTLVTIRNFREASECFSKAIALNPTILDNHIKLAQSLEFQERYDDAIAALKKAAALMSNMGNKGAVAKLQKYLEFVEFRKSKQEK